MSDWFKEVTKTLADGTLTRRQALRRIAGSTAGAALVLCLPGSVLAQSKEPHTCTNRGCLPGCCHKWSDYTNCGTNQNCYCFSTFTADGFKGACGCNFRCYTPTATPCSHKSHCPKGYFCAFGTVCGCPGLCVQYCTKTCHLDANRAGRTAAGV